MMPICLSNYPAFDGYYHLIAETKIGHWIFHDFETQRLCEQIVAQTVISKEAVELVDLAAACDHIHILIRTEYDPQQVTAVIFEMIAWRMKMVFPFLGSENPYHLWNQTVWKAIADQHHLQNCIGYIRRHQPYSSKPVQMQAQIA